MTKPDYAKSGLTVREKAMIDAVWLAADDAEYFETASPERIANLLERWRKGCSKNEFSKMRKIEIVPGVGNISGLDRSRVLDGYQKLCQEK